ncbi:DUF6188 family protein [Saccharomonospora azurea]|uniref:DUF6188 family protein n=1 Tax=Saccharomonospora azurea TaxID=40988 RepID=UPI003D914B96
MKLDLSGRLVTSCDYSYAATIRFTGEFELSFEGDALLDRPDRRVNLSPENDGGAGGEALSELNDLRVTASIAEESGQLRVTFEDGTTLWVHPDDEFESWTLAGPNASKIVCMPGGELAVWSGAQGD